MLLSWHRNQVVLDPAGVFADVKLRGSSFEPLPLRTRQDHALLVKAVSAAVESLTPRARLSKGRQ
jgi:hypothetical protein